MRTISHLTLTLLLVLGLTSLSVGQSGGKISGTVLEKGTGESLIGVQVILDGTTKGTVTDIDGYYSIIDISPDVYTVVFKYIGFKEVRVQNVQVIPGKTTEINVEMEEGVLEGEEVIITAERPIVQKDRTTTTAFISNDQLESLPVASVSEAVNLQAGVVEGHFRGGRLNEVSYVVNGVPINNPFTNEAGFEVEQNMVSSLEVITGVFNAEFGQATSGVVNIETKSPPKEWRFTTLANVGLVGSFREMEFVKRNGGPGSALSIDDFSTENVSYWEATSKPNRYEVQFNGGGPILNEKVGMNMSLRYIKDKGSFLGRDLFQPDDYSGNEDIFRSTFLTYPNTPEEWLIESTGSGDFVSMSESERFSINSSLTYFATRDLKLDYNIFYQEGSYRGFNHFRKYTPDGRNTDYFGNLTQILASRYSISDKTFVKLSYSYQIDDYENRLYGGPTQSDSVFDSRIVPSNYDTQTGPFTFPVGGNDINYARNESRIHTIVGSLTSQINRYNQIKVGFQTRIQSFNDVNIGIDVLPRNNYQPVRTSQEWRNSFIDITPFEFSVYAQDKIELENLIINAGLRFDYFDPDFVIPRFWNEADNLTVTDPETGEEVSNRVSTDPKYQLSPRIGVAFPISATGVIRFSYGLFFQIPNYADIYSTPQYQANPLGGTFYGNPNVDPQSTSTFEIGLQQGLTDALGMELTLYTKDVRNLLRTTVQRSAINANPIGYQVNGNYGTVRGLTLSLFQKPVNGLSFTLDYTLQFVDGSFNVAGDQLLRAESGLDVTYKLARLDWDRRHVINNSLTFEPNDSWTVSVVNTFQTGRPYTTQRTTGFSTLPNNADRPYNFNTDLQLYYKPFDFKYDVELFLRIDNLFDIRNQVQVYSNSGTATENPEMERFDDLLIQGVNSIEDYFFRQDFFSRPRTIDIGFRVRI